ncbi:MAG: hypothetical protein JWN85_3375 [Gammaproteobacteria bacterium]|nr:hypothetical protein [Gammaproteobacteria bacterium]
MQDPLIDAARRLGVPTHTSAGPEPGSMSGQLWATWPRDRLEIAHDALAKVVRFDRAARVEPCGEGNLWRASAGSWSYESDFVDAVATLALRVSETRPTEPPRSTSPRPARQ